MNESAATEQRAASPDGVRTVVVVGAGISGLAAAWALARRPGVHVVVLDGARSVGGKLALAEVDGVQVDVGAESLLALRPEAVDLARQVGLGDELEPPRPVGASLWSRGALRGLPPRTLMGVPSGDQGLDGLLTADEVDQLLGEAGRSFPPLEHDVDVASFVSGRVGPSVVDRLVEPLLGGVYAGRVDLLSLRATMPALWTAAQSGRSLVETARAAGTSRGERDEPRPVFASVRGGVGRLPLTLRDRLARLGVTIRTGTMVRRLQRTTSGWRLVHGPAVAEQALEADAVVLALPAAPASRLLGPLLPSAARALADVPYASMAIVTLVLPDDGHLPLAGSGFLVPSVEDLHVKASTFSSLKWGWLDEAAPGRAVLRASIGRYGQADELQHTDGDLVRAVMADLQTVLGPLPTPSGTSVMRWGGGLPQYTVGHVERMAAVRHQVATLPGLAVCGAAYDGVGIPACIASGTAAADQVLASLAPAAGSVPPAR